MRRHSHARGNHAVDGVIAVKYHPLTPSYVRRATKRVLPGGGRRFGDGSRRAVTHRKNKNRIQIPDYSGMTAITVTYCSQRANTLTHTQT